MYGLASKASYIFYCGGYVYKGMEYCYFWRLRIRIWLDLAFLPKIYE